MIGGFRCSPIHFVFDVTAIASILDQTRAPCAFISLDQFSKFEQAFAKSQTKSLHSVVIMDLDNQAIPESTSFDIHDLNTIWRLCGKNYVIPTKTRGERDPVFLGYTSGSTGLPKGSIMTTASYLSRLSGYAGGGLEIGLFVFWFFFLF